MLTTNQIIEALKETDVVYYYYLLCLYMVSCHYN